MNKGILVAIEGGDGAGKATQTELTRSVLSDKGYPVRKVSFPAYGQPSCTLVESYLRGEFGTDPNAVNAYAASLFYAVDRYATFKKDWGKQYEDGGIILADRYTTANALFQATKIPEDERKAYLDWLYDLEYTKVGLPKPDLVVYLDVPPEVSERMRTQREANTNTQADIHENIAMQRKVRESALFVAEHGGWAVVNCVDENNNIRSIEDINKDIMMLVEATLKKGGQ